MTILKILLLLPELLIVIQTHNGELTLACTMCFGGICNLGI